MKHTHSYRLLLAALSLSSLITLAQEPNPQPNKPPLVFQVFAGAGIGAAWSLAAETNPTQSLAATVACAALLPITPDTPQKEYSKSQLCANSLTNLVFWGAFGGSIGKVIDNYYGTNTRPYMFLASSAIGAGMDAKYLYNLYKNAQASKQNK